MRDLCFDSSGTYLAVAGSDVRVYLCKQWNELKVPTWYDMIWPRRIVAFNFFQATHVLIQSPFRFWVSTLLSPQEWDSEGTLSFWSPPALTGPSRSMAAPKLQQLELFWEFFETQKHFAPLRLWIEWTVHFSEFKIIAMWTRNNNTTYSSIENQDTQLIHKSGQQKLIS